ncbi:MAG: hypothetical protein HYY84_10790 [Deltaproteobacteria bacterium]|nr:hypothetical protein [Deltaproteobacteria bacterium]
MTTNSTQSVMGNLNQAETLEATNAGTHIGAAPVDRGVRAEVAQRRGKRLIVGGFAVMIVGIILYCTACFAGGVSAEIADILLQNAIPFGRIALAVIGVGVVLWLVGSFQYLKGAMDADAPGPGNEAR